MSQRVHRLVFREWFGLPPAESAVLASLFDGRAATPAQIATAAEVRAGTVEYLICQLRKSLEAEAIDFVPGAGYQLTEVGVAECRTALERMGEEMRNAS